MWNQAGCNRVPCSRWIRVCSLCHRLPLLSVNLLACTPVSILPRSAPMLPGILPSIHESPGLLRFALSLSRSRGEPPRFAAGISIEQMLSPSKASKCPPGTMNTQKQNNWPSSVFFIRHNFTCVWRITWSSASGIDSRRMNPQHQLLKGKTRILRVGISRQFCVRIMLVLWGFYSKALYRC